MSSDTRQIRSSTWLPVILAISLFLAIAGGRLLLLQKFGTDLPQFDAWGIEGEIFKSYFNGTLRPADFFSPCNEHRVVFARLLSLGLLIGNGLWDNRLQAVVNALLFSATGATFYLALARKVTPAAAIVLWPLLLATFAVPFGWENALWGFQSHFYLLVAFAFAAIYFAHGRESLNGGNLIFSGFLQIAALFTMASGVLASMAILATSALVLTRSWHSQARKKLLALQMTIAVAVIIFWKIAVYFPVPGHNHLKAQNLGFFAEVLTHCLSWPHVESSWWWIFAWLPWVILTVSYLLCRGEDRGMNRFTICLGIWVLLQAAATAYSRAPVALSSKYADPLSLGMAVNGLAMVLLYHRFNRPARMVLLLAAAGWAGWNGFALYGQSKAVLNGILPEKQAVYDIQLSRTLSYLATGNFTFLIPEFKHEIPDRTPEAYAKRLADPVISRIMPRSINLSYRMTGLPAAPLSRLSDFLRAAALHLLLSGASLAAICLLFICKDHLRKRKEA